MVQRLVQKKHPFIFLRENTCYFRFATPTHVRRLLPEFPKEVKRSLKADSYAQAVSLVGRKLDVIRLISQCSDGALSNGKYRKDNQPLFENLLHFVGDVPVSSVTKASLKNALKKIAGLPQRNKNYGFGKFEHCIAEFFNYFHEGSELSNEPEVV